MTRRLTRKELLKQDEFVDSAVEATHWIEENWRTVVVWAVVALVIGGIALGIWGYRGYSREQAEAHLADGIRLYQQAEAAGFENPQDVEAALAEFDDAAGRMAAGPAGLTATYYRGAALYRLGRLDDAAQLLDGLSKRNLPKSLAGSTDALRAEILADRNEPDRAIEILERLSAAEDPTYPPDLALVRIGKIHQAQGDIEQAREVWQRVTEEYPQSNGAMEAGRLLSASGS
jgi:predicted negative regulator of RcsB-dependent stress response